MLRTQNLNQILKNNLPNKQIILFPVRTKLYTHTLVTRSECTHTSLGKFSTLINNWENNNMRGKYISRVKQYVGACSQEQVDNIDSPRGSKLLVQQNRQSYMQNINGDFSNNIKNTSIIRFSTTCGIIMRPNILRFAGKCNAGMNIHTDSNEQKEKSPIETYDNKIKPKKYSIFDVLAVVSGAIICTLFIVLTLPFWLILVWHIGMLLSCIFDPSFKNDGMCGNGRRN
jgi:hypothetical protein